MEIGIGTMIPGVYSSMVGYALPGYAPGGSLRAWRDFFHNGRIVGVDVQPDTQFTEDRVETFLCNTVDAEASRQFFEKLEGRKFDVVLDDGAHYDEYCHFQEFLSPCEAGWILHHRGCCSRKPHPHRVLPDYPRDCW